MKFSQESMTTQTIKKTTDLERLLSFWTEKKSSYKYILSKIFRNTHPGGIGKCCESPA